MHFSSIWPIDRTLSSTTTPRMSGCGSNGNERGTPHSPKLQHYWNFTIRLFSVISWTLIGGVLPLCREAISVFYSPSRLGNILLEELCIMQVATLHTYIYIYIYIYIYAILFLVIVLMLKMQYTIKMHIIIFYLLPNSTALEYCNQSYLYIALQKYNCIKKMKLVSIVEGDPKAPFSLATTSRCMGECYSFPWITPLYPWLVPYNAKC